MRLRTHEISGLKVRNKEDLNLRLHSQFRLLGKLLPVTMKRMENLKTFHFNLQLKNEPTKETFHSFPK